MEEHRRCDWEEATAGIIVQNPRERVCAELGIPCTRMMLGTICSFIDQL